MNDYDRQRYMKRLEQEKELRKQRIQSERDREINEQILDAHNKSVLVFWVVVAVATIASCYLIMSSTGWNEALFR
jgi:hypothetical protein